MRFKEKVMLKRLRPFDYLRPSTLKEALQLLNDYNGEAKILAGGTDLLVGMKEKGLSPGYVIDIKGIEGLDRISYTEKHGLTVGALATMNAIAESSYVRKQYDFLAYAASKVASVQVRNRATIGGNLCNAAPSAETAPALLCLDARVKLVGLKKERTVPIEEFFKGPGMTVLNGEILTEIQVPAEKVPAERVPSKRMKGMYIKHSPRRAMDVAVIGVAAAIRPAGDGKKWEEVRIALGAVAPTPIRVPEAEELLEKEGPTQNAIQKAKEIAMRAASPIFDVRASAEYRNEMVGNLVQRVLQKLAGN
jgi:CO/xanthine dehydrogenase FAD-binding subunit